MRNNQRWTRSLGGLVLIFVMIVAVNLMGAYFYTRADFTEEGLYTLSQGSRKIVAELREPVRLQFFQSKTTEMVSPRVVNYARRVVELLEEYVQASDGFVDLDIVRLEPDSDEEEWASKYGLQAVPLPTGDSFYFGMVATQLDREAVIPFFDPSREEFLEYDIDQALYKLMQEEKPRVGILSSLPVLGSGLPPEIAAMQGRGKTESWALVDQLKETYQVENVDAVAKNLPKDLDLLLVIHPKKLEDSMLYAIDQYVLGGGKLVVLVDPSCRADNSSPGGLRQGRLPDRSSDLPKLFKAWGVKMEPKIVSDIDGALMVNTQQGRLNYPLWIQVGKKGVSQDELVTHGLENLNFIEAGHFVAEASEEGKKGVEITPLVRSSTNATTVDLYRAMLGDPLTLAREHKSDGKQLDLAIRISGQLKTAFPEGRPQEKEEDSAPEKGPEAKPEEGLRESKGEVTVILFADVDWLTDDFSIQTSNFFGRRVLQPLNDNLSLLMNVTEVMTGSQALISVRSRGKSARPFDRVIELKKQAQKKWQKQEQELTAKLQELQRKLSDLQQKKKGMSKLYMSPEQQKEIRRFREEQRLTKRKRREVRSHLRREIEALGNRLAVANLFGMPFLIAMAGLIFAWYKRKKLRS